MPIPSDLEAYDCLDQILLALKMRGHDPRPDEEGGFLASCPVNRDHNITISEVEPWVHCLGGCDAATVFDHLDRRISSERLVPARDGVNAGTRPVSPATLGPFSRVPLAICRRADIHDRVLKLFIALIYYLNDWNDLSKGSTVFQTVLATEMGRSVKTVQRAVREAEKAKLLTVQRGGPHQQNTYTLKCMIDMANQTAIGTSETHPTGSGRRGDGGHVATQQTTVSPPSDAPVATQPTGLSPSLDTEISVEGDLSIRRRGASGARQPHHQDHDADGRRARVTAELLSEGYSAEEIREGFQSPEATWRDLQGGRVGDRESSQSEPAWSSPDERVRQRSGASRPGDRG